MRVYKARARQTAGIGGMDLATLSSLFAAIIVVEDVLFLFVGMSLPPRRVLSAFLAAADALHVASFWGSLLPDTVERGLASLDLLLLVLAVIFLRIARNYAYGYVISGEKQHFPHWGLSVCAVGFSLAVAGLLSEYARADFEVWGTQAAAVFVGGMSAAVLSFT